MKHNHCRWQGFSWYLRGTERVQEGSESESSREKAREREKRLLKVNVRTCFHVNRTYPHTHSNDTVAVWRHQRETSPTCVDILFIFCAKKICDKEVQKCGPRLGLGSFVTSQSFFPGKRGKERSTVQNHMLSKRCWRDFQIPSHKFTCHYQCDEIIESLSFLEYYSKFERLRSDSDLGYHGIQEPQETGPGTLSATEPLGILVVYVRVTKKQGSSHKKIQEFLKHGSWYYGNLQAKFILNHRKHWIISRAGYEFV